MPNYLLDTHTFLWYAAGDSSLSQTVKNIIDNKRKEHNLYLSSVSLWEMGIKLSLGKLQLPSSTSLEKLVKRQCKLVGYTILPIQLEHIITNISLPFHHKDPFDRLLIAQALKEHFIFLSKDQKMSAYQQQQLSLVW